LLGVCKAPRRNLLAVVSLAGFHLITEPQRKHMSSIDYDYNRDDAMYIYGMLIAHEHGATNLVHNSKGVPISSVKERQKVLARFAILAAQSFNTTYEETVKENDAKNKTAKAENSAGSEKARTSALAKGIDERV
jgi:hypothetical protein